MMRLYGAPAEREAQLRLQHEALDKLFRCGWTMEQVAAAVGVRSGSVLRWKRKEGLASPGPHTKLIAAAKNSCPPDNIIPARKNGRLTEEQKRRRDQLLKQWGLGDPVSRSNTLQEIVREYRLRVSELAAKLGVGKYTALKYLDPQYTGGVAYPVAERIQALRARGIEHGALSLDERFQIAARRLFGRYYDTGFPANDRRNLCMIRRLSSLTGITERTIYRNLPPYDFESSQHPRLGPSRKLVEAFELAARLLANLA
jgi:transcriptional regulator with XRE-family HTH domain